jgi:hypothetical protein
MGHRLGTSLQASWPESTFGDERSPRSFVECD